MSEFEFEFARRLSCTLTYPQRCRLPHSRYVLLVWAFPEIWREWPPPSPVLSPIGAQISTNFGWNVWPQTCCCSPAPRPFTKLTEWAPISSLLNHLFPKIWVCDSDSIGSCLAVAGLLLMMPGIRNWVSQSEKIGKITASWKMTTTT